MQEATGAAGGQLSHQRLHRKPQTAEANHRQLASVQHTTSSTNTQQTYLVEEAPKVEHRWSTVVLLASALTNTLLLAFLFKAGQLDHRGLLAGRVSPLLEGAGTRLVGPTRTSGQLAVSSSISQQQAHSKQLNQQAPLILKTSSIISPLDNSTPLLSHSNSLSPLLQLKAARLLQLRLNSTTLLLSFNATSSQLQLQLQTQLLKLVHSPTTTSLSLPKGLQTSQLEPALQQPLQIQAAQSSLLFRTTPHKHTQETHTLRLVARAGQVTLTSSPGHGHLSLNAPILNLSAAKGLWLQQGLQYFDSPIPQAARRNDDDDQPLTANRPQMQLAAHTLLAVNGFLMASSAQW